MALLFFNYCFTCLTLYANAYYIGLPPFCHGSSKEGQDIELQLIKNGIHIFIEKPVSAVPPEEFQPYVKSVVSAASTHRSVVSVGYMFRYHPAIVRIKEELAKHGRPIIAINARYSSTYSSAIKPFWWDLDLSGGPIVEQATHFCDLIRYFGGEIALDTIHGVAVPLSTDSTEPGYLASLPSLIKDANIPKERQVPCATQATWRFHNGSIGSLTHTVTLHGFRYESYIDIWCDGMRMSLKDPYTTDCSLSIRHCGSEQETIECFADADPYYVEDKYFFGAIRKNDLSFVRSTYADAAKTYELTWAIRRATIGR